MKSIIVDGYILKYQIVRNNNQKSRCIIRVKDKEIVVASAINAVTEAEIEERIKEKINHLRPLLPYSNKENIIHFLGVGYRPKFLVSDTPCIRFLDNEIWIYAKSTDVEAYKKVLYDYYEYYVKKELERLLPQAYYDFKEIVMPTFSIHYFIGRFGDNDIGKNHVRLSSVLGKYDPKYVKLVLYHELSHSLVPNHSKKFYEVFERKYKNAKEEDLAFKALYRWDCL